MGRMSGPIRFEQRLRVVHAILLHVGADTHQLLVGLSSVDEVLHVVVAVTEQTQGRARLRVVRELCGQELDGIRILS
jgi:hypothetical protein